jgi:hypothetical protein
MTTPAPVSFFDASPRFILTFSLSETAQTMSHILRDLSIEQLEEQKKELANTCESLKGENAKIFQEIKQVNYIHFVCNFEGLNK